MTASAGQRQERRGEESVRVRFVLDTCTAADAGGGRERQAGEETWIDEGGREGGRAAEEKHRNSEIVSAEKLAENVRIDLLEVGGDK